MSDESIGYDLERSTGILTLTLRRPDLLNALTKAMIDTLISAFDEADHDDAVRVVIITGSGKGFCAGTDLSGGAATFRMTDPPPGDDEVPDHRSDRPAARPDPGGPLALRIFASLKPVIGAVNGAAVGVGATMTLPMDIRIASEAAKFGFVFNRRGITPDACSSWFLPRVVGISQAMEWVTTGRVFSAAEALDGRLVSKVLPADQLMDRAHELACEVAGNTAPVSVAMSRRLLWQMMGAPHPREAHLLESKALAARGASPDAKEGIEAFLQKRPAAFPVKVSDGMPDWFLDWDRTGAPPA